MSSFNTIAIHLALLAGTMMPGCTQEQKGRADHSVLSAGRVPARGDVLKIDCPYAKTHNGALGNFAAYAVKPLGIQPRVQLLTDANDPQQQHPNPVQEDADRFLRATSAVRFDDANGSNSETMERRFKIITAQDSRRKLGTAAFDMTLAEVMATPQVFAKAKPAAIAVIPVDSVENIARYESDLVDYASVRKSKKRDFEAMTTLPQGDFLVLGSGSDILKLQNGKPNFRSLGIIFSPRTGTVTRYDLTEFYKNLQDNRDFIGADNEAGKAHLNIEGVTVRPNRDGHIISFFHRGNINGNGHNAIAEFSLVEWLTAIQASQLEGAPTQPWGSVEPLRIVELQLPWVASVGDPSGKAVPLAINDGLVSGDPHRPVFFIPAGAEAEYTDAKGIHQDGVVTFAGIIRLEVDAAFSPETASCAVFQAPGDPPPGSKSVFGKVEGLAAFGPGSTAYERSLFSPSSLVIGVTDVDSEIAPSTLSLLDFRPIQP